ncbi:SUMF1/EgtB/PvdO family nonheme iron enzyme [bacterium]|nr:SUMF1/EgtB/PvdO family nonheme iron enzyme [bacterium]
MKTVFILLFLFVFPTSLSARNESIRIEFSDSSIENNGLRLMGPGFNDPGYTRADISFGLIPVNNAFEDATDGTGAIVEADVGEGLLILMNPICTTQAGMVRCSVRASQAANAITIGTIDSGNDKFINTTTPNNGSCLVGRYKRLSTFFVPPSTGFQPVIQIINTSDTEPLTVYLDNVEIFTFDPNRVYDPEFFDGDETDPAIASFAREQVILIPTPTPTPRNTPTPFPIEPGDTVTIPLELPEGAVPLEMVLIPAGSFIMGSSHGAYDEMPEHKVTLTKNFFMGKYEITQAQWESLMGYNRAYAVEGPNYPVDWVRWEQCQEFLEKLNSMGHGTFRLPTEAEWEYACRAGTTTRFYWGDDPKHQLIHDYAKYWYHSPAPLKVGSKRPNAFGLYDMSGNVWEWCHDLYSPNYYMMSPEIDPMGPTVGRYHALRGGSAFHGPDCARSAFRTFISKDHWPTLPGFRIMRLHP